MIFGNASAKLSDSRLFQKVCILHQLLGLARHAQLTAVGCRSLPRLSRNVTRYGSFALLCKQFHAAVHG